MNKNVLKEKEGRKIKKVLWEILGKSIRWLNMGQN